MTLCFVRCEAESELASGSMAIITGSLQQHLKKWGGSGVSQSHGYSSRLYLTRLGMILLLPSLMRNLIYQT